MGGGGKAEKAESWWPSILIYLKVALNNICCIILPNTFLVPD